MGLHEICVSGDANAVLEALSQSEAPVKTKDVVHGRFPLHYAASAGSAAVCQVLLENGADINCRDGNGYTPLHLACMSDKEETAAFLIKRGADVHALSNNGKTALHVAVGARSKSCAKLLLDKGADTRAKNNSGQSILHIAVHAGDAEMVEVLLSNGAGVDAYDNFKDTPLHAAARLGDAPCTQAIIEYVMSTGGSDAAAALVDAKNNFGKTAVDLASQKGHGDVSMLLIKARNRLQLHDMDPLHPHLQEQMLSTSIPGSIANSRYVSPVLSSRAGRSPSPMALSRGPSPHRANSTRSSASPLVDGMARTVANATPSLPNTPVAAPPVPASFAASADMAARLMRTSAGSSVILESKVQSLRPSTPEAAGPLLGARPHGTSLAVPVSSRPSSLSEVSLNGPQREETPVSVPVGVPIITRRRTTMMGASLDRLTMPSPTVIYASTHTSDQQEVEQLRSSVEDLRSRIRDVQILKDQTVSQLQSENDALKRKLDEAKVSKDEATTTARAGEAALVSSHARDKRELESQIAELQAQNQALRVAQAVNKDAGQGGGGGGGGGGATGAGATGGGWKQLFGSVRNGSLSARSSTGPLPSPHYLSGQLTQDAMAAHASEAEELRHTVKSLRERVKQLENEMQVKEQTLEVRSKEKELMVTRLEEMRAQVEVKATLKREADKEERSRQALLERVIELESMLVARDGELKRRTAEKEELMRKRDDERQAANSADVNRRRSDEESLAKAMDEMSRLKDVEVDAARKNMDSLQARMLEQERTIIHLESELEQKKRQYREVEEGRRILLDAKDDLHREKIELAAKLQIGLGKSDEVQGQLRAEIAKVTLLLEQAESRNDELSDARAVLLSAKTAVDERLEKAEARLRSKEMELEVLRVQLKDLSATRLAEVTERQKLEALVKETEMRSERIASTKDTMLDKKRSEVSDLQRALLQAHDRISKLELEVVAKTMEAKEAEQALLKNSQMVESIRKEHEEFVIDRKKSAAELRVKMNELEEMKRTAKLEKSELTALIKVLEKGGSWEEFRDLQNKVKNVGREMAEKNTELETVKNKLLKEQDLTRSLDSALSALKVAKDEEVNEYVGRISALQATVAKYQTFLAAYVRPGGGGGGGGGGRGDKVNSGEVAEVLDAVELELEVGKSRPSVGGQSPVSAGGVFSVAPPVLAPRPSVPAFTNLPPHSGVSAPVTNRVLPPPPPPPEVRPAGSGAGLEARDDIDVSVFLLRALDKLNRKPSSSPYHQKGRQREPNDRANAAWVEQPEDSEGQDIDDRDRNGDRNGQRPGQGQGQGQGQGPTRGRSPQKSQGRKSAQQVQGTVTGTGTPPPPSRSPYSGLTTEERRDLVFNKGERPREELTESRSAGRNRDRDHPRSSSAEQDKPRNTHAQAHAQQLLLDEIQTASLNRTASGRSLHPAPSSTPPGPVPVPGPSVHSRPRQGIDPVDDFLATSLRNRRSIVKDTSEEEDSNSDWDAGATPQTANR